MSFNVIRSFEAMKHLCPFLSKQTQLTEELLAKNAQRCPFMKHSKLVSDDAIQTLENLSENLSNPLNFLDLEIQLPTEENMFEKHFQNAIQLLKDEGRYRVFTNILRHAGKFPCATEFMTGQERDITV